MGGLAKLLVIKKNALIMLTNNVDIDDRLINGQFGTVFSVKYDINCNVQVVYVKFLDPIAGLRIRRSDTFAYENNVVPIKMIAANIPVTKHPASPSIVRTQFPLMLAWTCTVHKVQGLTLPNAVISFQLNHQCRFNAVKSM